MLVSKTSKYRSLPLGSLQDYALNFPHHAAIANVIIGVRDHDAVRLWHSVKRRGNLVNAADSDKVLRAAPKEDGSRETKLSFGELAQIREEKNGSIQSRLQRIVETFGALDF